MSMASLCPRTCTTKFTVSDIIEYFESTMRDDPNISEAVAAIKTLIEFIQVGSGELCI